MSKKSFFMLENMKKIKSDLLWNCFAVSWFLDFGCSPVPDNMVSFLQRDDFDQWQHCYCLGIAKEAMFEDYMNYTCTAAFEKCTLDQKKAVKAAVYNVWKRQVDSIQKNNYNYYQAFKAIKSVRMTGVYGGSYEDIYSFYQLKKNNEVSAIPFEVVENHEVKPGNVVNAPLVAVLYYNAIRSDIDLELSNGLSEKDVKDLINVFGMLDAFYRGHRDEIKSEYHLLKAFIDENYRDEETRLVSKPVNSITYPLDKLSETWSLSEELASTVSIDNPLGLRVEKKGSKKEVRIAWGIDFQEIKEEIVNGGGSISENLDNVDMLYYIVVHALWEKGNEYMTIPQIWNTAGYRHNPSQTDMKKVLSSLLKMSSATIMINNEQEQKAGYNYPLVKYRGPLLAMEVVTVEIDGNIVKSAIHVFREPIMMKFAKDRKQITTLKSEVLKSPVSKNKYTLAIQAYLIRRIERERHNKKDEVRVLYETLLRETGLENTKKPKRYIEYVERYLGYYKEIKYIYDFEMDIFSTTFKPNKNGKKPGITIKFSAKAAK